MEAVKEGTTAGLELLGGRRPAAGAGVRVGTLVAVEAGGGLRVVYPGRPDPLAARATVSLTPADAGRQAVLAFEDGDPERPIVLGLLETPRAAEAPREVAGTVETDARREVRVDGRRVQLEADHELVLRCGRSSLTLRADGRVTIRGMQIVSRARGTHKVKGGHVQIN